MQYTQKKGPGKVKRGETVQKTKGTVSGKRRLGTGRTTGPEQGGGTGGGGWSVIGERGATKK